MSYNVQGTREGLVIESRTDELEEGRNWSERIKAENRIAGDR